MEEETVLAGDAFEVLQQFLFHAAFGDVDAAVAEVRSQTDAKLRQREADRQDPLARIGAEEMSAQAALDTQQAAANEARFAASRESLMTGDVELKRLQDELAKAIEDAKPKTAIDALGEGGEPGAQKLPTPEGIGEALDQSEAKTDVKGSFSAAALRGLGAGDSSSDRTAKATEKTVEELGKLRDDVRRSRPAFTA